MVNSGKLLKHWYWDQFIIDLSSVEHSDTTPGLIDHDFGRRATVGKLTMTDGQLNVAGRLLSNQHGQAVAQDADEGFP